MPDRDERERLTAEFLWYIAMVENEQVPVAFKASAGLKDMAAGGMTRFAGVVEAWCVTKIGMSGEKGKWALEGWWTQMLGVASQRGWLDISKFQYLAVADDDGVKGLEQLWNKGIVRQVTAGEANASGIKV